MCTKYTRFIHATYMCIYIYSERTCIHFNGAYALSSTKMMCVTIDPHACVHIAIRAAQGPGPGAHEVTSFVDKITGGRFSTAKPKRCEAWCQWMWLWVGRKMVGRRLMKESIVPCHSFIHACGVFQLTMSCMTASISCL